METHSEHLLLRFLRRLAETSLYTKKDFPYRRPPLFLADLSFVYVERNHKIGKSICEAIIVNKMGEYVQQPTGFVEFFGEDFSEILAIGQVRAEWASIGEENDSSM